MKSIKTGAFFWDQDVGMIQQQADQLKVALHTIQQQYGETIVNLHEDTVDQIVNLWLQVMSPSRLPLLVMNTDQHPLFVNNLGWPATQKIDKLNQLNAYLDKFKTETITDVDGQGVTYDELKAIVQQVKPPVRSLNLGQSLINDSNVLHRENQNLQDQYQMDAPAVDDYVISYQKSHAAAEDLLKLWRGIDGLVVPDSKDVRRDLLEYVLINYQIQLLKLKADCIPVVYVPTTDAAFQIFELLHNPAMLVEKWGSHQFELVDGAKVADRVLQLSRFSGDDITQLKRLPTADDPNGDHRRLIKGTNPAFDDTAHYLDVIS